MSALTIFKHAGVSEKLGFDLGQLGQKLQQGWNGISPYAQKGLIGAGIGGLGMGAASLMGGDDENLGSNVLKGMALGGAGGLGYQAIRDKWFNPNSGLTPELAALQQKARQKGEELDMNSYGTHHPVKATLKHWVDPENSPISPTGAALGGVGINALKSRTARAAIGAGKDGQHMPLFPADPSKGGGLAQNISNLSTGTKQRVMENLAHRAGALPGDRAGIEKFLTTAKMVPKGADQDAMVSKILNELDAGQGKFSNAAIRDSSVPQWLDKMVSKIRGKAQYNTPQPGAALGLPKQTLRWRLGNIADRMAHQATSAAKVLNPFNNQTLEGQTNWGAKLNNILGKAKGANSPTPYALRNMVRYGKYGAGAAAGTALLQHGGNMVGDALTNFTPRWMGGYSPEQLEVWNRGGMR